MFGRVIIAAATLAAALPSPAHAGGRYGPELVDKYAVPAVRSGATEWVKTWWTSKSDVCDVRVVVSAPGVTVTYPENTKTYTSFRRTADLARGDNDYTAFRVTATAAVTRWIDLRTEVSYTKLAAGTLRPGSAVNVPCTGDRSDRITTTRLLILGG
ncbi:hypothetical protein [Actinoplanes sp. NPDC049802]|uniref:hypothetical protein n=1 Tax=Actinoplanes sp. NPDC049802 TaxID=3154742 RepID=UPI0033D80790